VLDIYSNIYLHIFTVRALDAGQNWFLGSRLDKEGVPMIANGSSGNRMLISLSERGVARPGRTSVAESIYIYIYIYI